LLLLPAEGIALGVPIFFATGSKWKAIAWAAASGLSEPVGALIGMALQLTGNLDPTAMGMYERGLQGCSWLHNRAVMHALQADCNESAIGCSHMLGYGACMCLGSRSWQMRVPSMVHCV
jgi:hypothetical protein